MRSDSFTNDDETKSAWDDETAPPHLPPILKMEDGEEINRFSRF
jgi:hypothetical protein